MDLQNKIFELLLTIKNFPKKDLDSALEYAEYHEGGIAFEVICGTIKDEQISINMKQYNDIKKLGLYMKMDNDEWRDFKPINTEIPKEKVEELNLVMPRVEFIENSLKRVSKLAKQINIFILEGEEPIGLNLTNYGNKSYKTLLKEIKNGKLKIPNNVRFIEMPEQEDRKEYDIHGAFDFISNYKSTFNK